MGASSAASSGAFLFLRRQKVSHAVLHAWCSCSMEAGHGVSPVVSLSQSVALLEPSPLVFNDDSFLQESAAGMVWDMHAHLQHTAQH